MSHQEEMRKAFIADIAANPEDIERRLIFADWLEDNGEPVRAALIRCTGEVTVFGSGSEYTTMATATFSSPMWRMAEEDTRRAVAVPGQLYVLPKRTVFRHGFIEEIHGPLDSLMKHLPRIVQEHPILSVRATDREPQEDREAFCWYREGSYVARETAMIPEEVWLRLENDDDNDIPARCRFCAYRTAERAHAALSKALLKLARDKR